MERISPSGRPIRNTRKGSRQLYRKPASGVGEDELIFASEDRKNLEDITPDGRTLIFSLQRKGANVKIYVLSIENHGHDKTFRFRLRPYNKTDVANPSRT